MPMQSRRRSGGGDQLVWTAPADTTAGTVVVVGTNLVGTLDSDTKSGEKGTLELDGVLHFRKTAAAINQGDSIYWAAAGNPANFTAGSGAASTTNTGKFLGYATAAAAASGSAASEADWVEVKRVHLSPAPA